MRSLKMTLTNHVCELFQNRANNSLLVNLFQDEAVLAARSAVSYLKDYLGGGLKACFSN
jgi:hypothetical protein